MSSQEMVVCVANGCSNKPCKDLSFFNFPDNKEQRARWISAIQKPEGWQPSPNSKICSVHFVTRTVSPYPWHPDYVPSVFRSLRTKKRDKSSRARQIIEAELGLDDKGGDGSDDSRKQKKGAPWRASEEVSLQNDDSFDAPRPTVGRKKKVTDAALLSESKRKLKQMEMSDVDFYEEDQMSVQSGLFDSHDDDSLIEAVTEVKPKRGRGRGRGRGRRGVGGRGAAAATRDQGLTEDGKCRNCQNYIQQIAVLQEELNAKKAIVAEWDDMVKEKSRLFKNQLDLYKGELQNVKEKLSALELNEEFFKKNKHRIVMYTGLPNYSVLITLFNLVNAAVKRDRHVYSITPFQKFILCLMRLRMNLKFKDLANRFAIDLCKIERFFPEWIDALHKQVSHVLVWPPDNVQYRLSMLSQSVREHYKIIKDPVPVTKFISSDGHIRKNHKIVIVCASLLHISEMAVSEVQDKLPDVLADKEETLVNYLKAVGKYMPPPPPPLPPVLDNVEKTELDSGVENKEEEKSSTETSSSKDKKDEQMDCEAFTSSSKVNDASDSAEDKKLLSDVAAPDEECSDSLVPETSNEEPEGDKTCASGEEADGNNASKENSPPVNSDAASDEISAQNNPSDATSDVTTDATPAVIESANATPGARATDIELAEMTSVDAASTQSSRTVSPVAEESSSPTAEATVDDGTSSEAAGATSNLPGAESAQANDSKIDESGIQQSSEASLSTEVAQQGEAENTTLLSTSENISVPLSESSSIPSVSGSISFSSASESISMPPVSTGEYFSSGPKVHSSKSADLSLFSQFLCVLLRLVNNLSKDEILLRLPKAPDSDDSVEQLFNKRDPDVAAIISAWLPWIHSRFMQLVTWPEVQDDSEEFLRALRHRYRYLQSVDPLLKMQAEAVSTALYNAGHHLYCVTSEEEEELPGDELVDWLF
ncbi:Zinc finger C2CH-type [Trinorchestia longiramus]|nr:Zinc finger C2CH-type [Trinorchestia longiramus]